MRILICPDKFKGSLTASEASTAIADGLRAAYGEAKIAQQPLADGGDGTLAVIAANRELRYFELATVDPLGRPMSARYAAVGETAYVELATASGLLLLSKDERDPLRTSTYGTGLLIKDALKQSFRRIVLFVGGSATHDLGLGIAAALGYRFLTLGGRTIKPTGEALELIRHLEPPRERLPAEVEISVITDVENLLLGERGAARVYAAQKGADAAAIAMLERGGERCLELLSERTGRRLENLAGGGAAGGVGIGLAALFAAEIKPGFDWVSELVGLEAQVAMADVVISGEGKLDASSLEGKVVGGVKALCERYEKPFYVLAGRSDLSTDQTGIAGIKIIMDTAKTEAAAIENAAAYLRTLAGQLVLKP